jgi:hypothetical protein
VIFQEPVAGHEVIEHGNRYDIGLFFMPPSNFNEEYSLANKVFQFVQSRLMLAVSPLPEMGRFVEEHGLGIVASDHSPRAMARQLNALTAPEIAAFKSASHRKARELSSEANRRKLLALVEALLTPAAPVAIAH